MFSPKKVDNAPNDREIRAFLEEGCEFEGKLHFSGVVRLNGKYKGEIESNDTLVIGDTAFVEGRIRVGALIVGGKIIGDIQALHRVEVLATGFIQGTLEAGTLVTHEGAVILAQLAVQRSEKNINPPKKAG
jgi:cytoskeletal protein CcmA (bactofilin family)